MLREAFAAPHDRRVAGGPRRRGRAPTGRSTRSARRSQDPHVHARDDVVEIPHPRFGTVRQLASPLRLRREPNPLDRAPFRGEHTDVVLRELAGYSDDEIAELRAGGTFG